MSIFFTRNFSFSFLILFSPSISLFYFDSSPFIITFMIFRDYDFFFFKSYVSFYFTFYYLLLIDFFSFHSSIFLKPNFLHIFSISEWCGCQCFTILFSHIINRVMRPKLAPPWFLHWCDYTLYRWPVLRKGTIYMLVRNKIFERNILPVYAFSFHMYIAPPERRLCKQSSIPWTMICLLSAW